MPRRSFLQIGVLGGLAVWGADGRWNALRGEATTSTKARGAIFVWLDGGPSHHDTFDPKPEAVAEIRGEFQAIETSVPGVRFAESLPQLARQMHHLAIIRSVTHPDAAHEPGRAHMQSGYAFRPGSNYPSLGAVVGFERQERSEQNGLPAFIAVPEGDIGAGHLGPGYNPFRVGGDPNADNFEVHDLAVAADLSADRLRRRRELLRGLNEPFAQAKRSEVQRAVERFTEQAYGLIATPQARATFDLGREPTALRDRYGRTTLGQSLLLARRLIEAGVPFVTVNDGGWDHHQQIYPGLKEKLPPLDAGLSALVEDLDCRGMLESTLVVLMGEFGRTPQINTDRGRDHWSRAFSVAFAGGGVRGGQVIGASDAAGAFPTDQPVTPEDLAHSIYCLLGLDPEKELPTISGRRIQMVRDGGFIRELVS